MSSGNTMPRLGVRRQGVAAVALAIAVVSRAVPQTALAETPRPAASRTIVDPALVQAGGCRGCNASSCRACQGRHGGHHPVCRDGKCHPHCPVRPQEFGFYGTQWRRWPDRQVVPVAHEREGTPALPPRSQVPRGEEEARRATDDMAAPQSDTAAPQSEQAADAADTSPKGGSEDEPPRRRPQPPQADEDPVLPPEASGGLQPRLLPQAVQGDEGPAPDQARSPADQRPTAATRRSSATQRPDVPRHESLPMAPEPTASHTVVMTAAEADEGIDESTLGPVRRRFVTRPRSLEGAGSVPPVPAAVP